ncbi:MAG: hypothetical protein GY832_03915 [Chloroflexi bacterium]|nr:hypothetical protein [Chloroflexota bacterium]
MFIAHIKQHTGDCPEVVRLEVGTTDAALRELWKKVMEYGGLDGVEFARIYVVDQVMETPLEDWLSKTVANATESALKEAKR